MKRLILEKKKITIKERVLNTDSIQELRDVSSEVDRGTYVLY